MEKVTLRLATPADVASLVTLRGAFLAEVNGANATEPALLDALSRYFSAALPTGEFIAYLAVVEDRVIATSGLVYHHHPPSAKNLQGREAYVMNMYTLPAWRGRGIASSLLKKLIDVARQSNCCRVALHALPKATSIYLRAGFVSVEREMRLDLQ